MNLTRADLAVLAEDLDRAREELHPDALALGLAELLLVDHELRAGPAVGDGHVLRAMTKARARAVHRGVAAADDHDVVADLERLPQVRLLHEVDAVIDALELGARDVEGDRVHGAGRDRDGVVLRLELLECDVLADRRVVHERHAEAFDQSDVHLDGLARQAEGRHADEHRAAAVGQAVEDRALVALHRELARDRDPGRPGADDRDPFGARSDLGHDVGDAGRLVPLDEEALHRADGQRTVDVAAPAGALARGGADVGAHGRDRVRLARQDVALLEPPLGSEVQVAAAVGPDRTRFLALDVALQPGGVDRLDEEFLGGVDGQAGTCLSLGWSECRRQRRIGPSPTSPIYHPPRAGCKAPGYPEGPSGVGRPASGTVDAGCTRSYAAKRSRVRSSTRERPEGDAGSVTASEFVFLGLGLVLGVAAGAALVEILRARPPAPREVRVTVAPDSVPRRRSSTLADDAFAGIQAAEPARGGPADRRGDAVSVGPGHTERRTPVRSGAPTDSAMTDGVGEGRPASLPARLPLPISGGADPTLTALRATAMSAAAAQGRQGTTALLDAPTGSADDAASSAPSAPSAPTRHHRMGARARPVRAPSPAGSRTNAASSRSARDSRPASPRRPTARRNAPTTSTRPRPKRPPRLRIRAPCGAPRTTPRRGSATAGQAP